jgi:hypothetical protein
MIFIIVFLIGRGANFKIPDSGGIGYPMSVTTLTTKRADATIIISRMRLKTYPFLLMA